jgi:NAD(P)-dependent dehydrogenase (short-subunit alcohol dehydrogenase family)
LIREAAMELTAGKVAVVTGAGRGIGLALAERFARAGLDVVLADVEQAALRLVAPPRHLVNQLPESSRQIRMFGQPRGASLERLGRVPMGQESRSAVVWPGLAFRWKAGMTPSP